MFMGHYFDQQPESGHQEQDVLVRMNGKDFHFLTDKSVFSKQRLDYGTALLLQAVLKDDFPKTGRLLDLGCGYGAVGIIMKKFRPAFSVVLSDINERAVSLAQKNAIENQVKSVEVIQSDGFSAIKGNFDVIMTNPPVRAGKKTVFRLFEESAEHLTPQGRLVVVMRKQQGAPSAIRKLKELFSDVAIIDRSAGYWVIQCQNPISSESL